MSIMPSSCFSLARFRQSAARSCGDALPSEQRTIASTKHRVHIDFSSITSLLHCLPEDEKVRGNAQPMVLEYIDRTGCHIKVYDIPVAVASHARRAALTSKWHCTATTVSGSLRIEEPTRGTHALMMVAP